jgi:hypothetical protein
LFNNRSFYIVNITGMENLRFKGKSGHLTAFPRACFIGPQARTNRVLEQAQLSI